MRQGGPGARRPRGRHNNGSEGGRGEGKAPPAGGGRVRSAAALRHQTFDSNGPDVRVRGNAWQVYEKYQLLARDAQSAGDRVMAENYRQHAEHYYRITEAIEEAALAEQRQRGGGGPTSFTSQQPDVPSNYYTPDGQLMGSPVAAAAAPVAAVKEEQTPAEAQVEKTGAATSSFYAMDDERREDWPQVAQR
ncbi:MAG: DUF4167 domain-containing protein [Alphaproteobacteria bacterium]|nr:DUF4167 domain-containing protein [Alphaproteobacteria bacterium]